MPVRGEKGFTLIEVAIVMIIIGLIMGGSTVIMRTLSDRKFRNETKDYLDGAKQALMTFAEIHGRLPYADTDGDGRQNPGAIRGTLPYIDIGIGPKDPYKRALAYEVNSGLIPGSSSVVGSMVSVCAVLRNGLGGPPRVRDMDAGTNGPFSVAAVIVSAGPKDADGAGGPGCFDAISGAGNNNSGRPNYVRSPPGPTFDDLVTYITGNELYGVMCGSLVLSVVNRNPHLTTFYVRDCTRGVDLGHVPGAYTIISGTTIGIYRRSNGRDPLHTDPPTPVTVAGQDYTITIIP